MPLHRRVLNPAQPDVPALLGEMIAAAEQAGEQPVSWQTFGGELLLVTAPAGPTTSHPTAASHRQTRGGRT